MTAASDKQWAKRQLLAELRALAREGFACNVQEWTKDSKRKNTVSCRRKRAAALRLLGVAISAVERRAL